MVFLELDSRSNNTSLTEILKLNVIAVAIINVVSTARFGHSVQYSFSSERHAKQWQLSREDQWRRSGGELFHHPSLCDCLKCHDCIASFGITFPIKNNHRMSRMYLQPKPLAIHASAILFTTIFDKDN
jgi:hypothetical protein